MRIVTHPGTATQTVCNLLRSLGQDVTVVTSADAAISVAFDAVILLGGADILPIWYGQPRTHTRGTDKDRDVIEWTLTRRALADRLPVFGICRGCQMLAAAAGGSLYQDLAAENSGAHPTRHGLVRVTRPLLQHLPTLQVNSLHHQAVRTVPFGFQVAAEAHDGVIEAIYRPGYLGVQWHPELLYEGGDHRWERLFAWFVSGLGD